MEERDVRPRNRYGERLYLARAGVERDRRARAPMLADVRATAGLLHGDAAQTVLSVTLPTAPAGGQFARGTPSVSVVHARRAAVGKWLVLQGTVGAGYTPRTGPLAPVQRALLRMGSAGGWLRVADGHALHASVFYHGPAYEHTSFPELDGSEVSVDFGYEWHAPGGRRWRLSLTEDTRRRDAGIDLAVRVSVE
jgi:hypothetical protein